MIHIRARRLPPRSIQKIYKDSVKVKVSMQDRITNSIIMPIAEPVARLIKIPEEKEDELKIALGRVGIPLSPSEYYAKAIVMTAMTLPLVFIVAVLGLKLLIPVALMFSVAALWNNLNQISEREKKKREQIEFLLPGFIRAIYHKLNDVRTGDEVVQADLIQIFEDYLMVASDDIFYYDVSKLVFDMKSKNIESSLNDFKNRIGIPEMSALVNALIGIHRGEAQNSALEILARDMDVKARENQKKYLLKLPGKVFAACWPMVGITAAALLYMVIADMQMKATGIYY